MEEKLFKKKKIFAVVLAVVLASTTLFAGYATKAEQNEAELSYLHIYFADSYTPRKLAELHT